MSDNNDCNDAILQMQLDLEDKVDTRGVDNMHQTVQEPQIAAANREPTGYEHVPTNSGYSSICKLDHRVQAATLISFDNLKNVTKEGNTSAGAILIEICGTDYWLPKKLCSNLDLELGTVYVWTTFLKEAKPELLEMIADREDEV